jgi:hypothetical protein
MTMGKGKSSGERGKGERSGGLGFSVMAALGSYSRRRAATMILVSRRGTGRRHGAASADGGRG